PQEPRFSNFADVAREIVDTPVKGVERLGVESEVILAFARRAIAIRPVEVDRRELTRHRASETDTFVGGQPPLERSTSERRSRSGRRHSKRTRTQRNRSRYSATCRRASGRISTHRPRQQLRAARRASREARQPSRATSSVCPRPRSSCRRSPAARHLEVRLLF